MKETREHSTCVWPFSIQVTEEKSDKVWSMRKKPLEIMIQLHKMSWNEVTHVALES